MVEGSEARAPYAGFARYYDALHEGVHDADAEVDFVEAALRLASERPVRRALDVGCGTGAHAVRLAARGVDVDGVDPSADMVALARAKAEARGVAARCRFHVADAAERLPDGPFDAAFSLGNALGYVADDAAAARFARHLGAALAPGAAALVESWSPLGFRPSAHWDRTTTADGTLVVRLIETWYSPTSRLMTLQMEFIALCGREVEAHFHETHRLRLRTPDETRALLAQGGLETVAFVEVRRRDLSTAPARPDAFRVAAVARRAEA